MKREPIAIVGMAALFPGSTDSAGFWSDVLAGRDLIGDVPPNHWLIEDYYDPDPSAPDKTYGKRGAFLSPIAFDALEFGVPPSALPAIDSSQLLALLGAKRVLADAARGRELKVARDRVGIYLGVAGSTAAAMNMAARLQRPVWTKALREAGLPESKVQEICDRIATNYTPFQENTFPGVLGNVVSGRIANRFDLGGGNFTVDAACASSLAAVSVAINDLYLGNADMAITGGVDALNNIQMYLCFSKTPALSATGDCRPFSDKADGTMLGEGLSMFALRRLEDAERDGDHIYAVIRGLGASSDGRAKSVYAPRSEGQAIALRRAYKAAGYGPESIALMEAHGTATPAGDVAEFQALSRVYRESGREDSQWCALGSVKSQLGHTKSAAGAASLFKVAMALHQKVLPPTIKVERPNPSLGIESSPFYLNTETRPWIHGKPHPRRASLSSFGFGGTNFHVTLEEYQGNTDRVATGVMPPAELMVLAGTTASEVVMQCESALQRLVKEGDWRRVARDSHSNSTAPGRVRLAIVASGNDDLRKKLQQAVGKLKDGVLAFSDPSGLEIAECDEKPVVAFLFAGQGSQFVGMGKDFALTFSPARAVWDRAEAVLDDSRFSLASVVFPRPAFSDDERAKQQALLTQTENAQPALAAAGIAQLAVLREFGVTADFAGGHSFGELVALCAGGVISERDLVLAARKRGELMSKANSNGAMTAVSYDAGKLRELLKEWNSDVVIANYNSPEQVVLSGAAGEIEAVEKKLSSASINYRRLPVSAAFHSPLVADAARPFADFLQGLEFASPHVTVLSNLDAQPYSTEPEQVRDKLAQHLASPVRFAEEIDALYIQGARVFVELGAGSVLTGFVGQCLKGRKHTAVALERKGMHSVTSLLQAIAKIYVAGVDAQLEAFAKYFPAISESQSASSSPSVFMIDGAGFNKPYPPAGGVAALPKPNPEPAVAASFASESSIVRAIPQEAKSYPQETQHVLAEPHNAPVAAFVPLTPTSMTIPKNGNGNALLEIQRQINEAQKATQAAILETHALTLKSLEALASGHFAPAELTRVSQVEVPRMAAPIARELVHEVPLAARRIEREPQYMQPAPVATSERLEEVVAKTVVAAVEAPPAEQPSKQPISQLLLEIVAEKTGYPIDVLNVDMDLESGLGIDSIKRVEIFSAIQQRATGLPDVKPSDMATLRTLRQIIEFLDQGSPADPVAPVVPASQPRVTVAAKPSAPPIDRLLLEIVAEKTGYPIDVLNVDMDLESGLGIDSIKRVEIFSAVQQRAADLPEVKPSDMATLRTLRQIIDFLGKTEPDAGAAQLPQSKTSDAAPMGVQPQEPVQRPDEARPTRSVVQMVPAVGPGLPMAGLFQCKDLVVTNDGRGIAEALVADLRRRSVAARLVEKVPVGADGCVFLGGLKEVSDIQSALAINFEAFEAAKALTQAPSGPRLFATVQDTGGDFGLSGESAMRAWSAGIAGVAKTFAQEWPQASVKAIDLDVGRREAGTLSRELIAEFLAGGSDLEVGLQSNGARVKPALAPVSVSRGRSRVDHNAVVVATGGGRGVTAACLIELAKVTRASFVLLGRTPLADELDDLRSMTSEVELKRALLARHAGNGSPDLAAVTSKVQQIMAGREVRATLAAMERAGARAKYLPVDINDGAALSAALEGVRREVGPVTCLVHGAGVLADKTIADKSPEQFRRVFDTKVLGLKALLDATASDPLDAIVLFSSVAARYGNAGQCDYAAANEILNKVAAAEARRRGDRCLVTSVNWGPWNGGMVAPSLAAHFGAAGVGLIPIEAGARSFVDELAAAGGGSCEVVIAAAQTVATDKRKSAAEHATEILVNAHTYPQLNDHRIKEHPAVPVVLVMEWFHRLAAARYPGLFVTGCEDLRVLKGIVLPRFDNGGHLLRLVTRELSNGGSPKIQAELRSPEGDVHYSARLQLSKAPATPSRGSAPSRQNGNGATTATDNLYESALFHGPEFRVIRSLDFIDTEKVAATVVGTKSMAWPSGPWMTDAAALDGALQVLRLWGLRTLGGPSLPTRIGACYQYAPSPPEGLMHCAAHCRANGKLSTISNVSLHDVDGNPVAEMHEVEMHLVPSESLA